MNMMIAEQVTQMSQYELGHLIEELMARLDPPKGHAITLAELDCRAEQALANPQDCATWEQVEAELLK